MSIRIPITIACALSRPSDAAGVPRRAWPMNNTYRVLAAGITGRTPQQCHGRLLFKILGGGVAVETVCALRIEELDVDLSARLSIRRGDQSTFIYALDDTDREDLLALVRATDTLDGPLFSDDYSALFEAPGEGPCGNDEGPADVARLPRPASRSEKS